VTQLTIGLLGCGNVGGAFADLLEKRRDAIAARTGIDLRVGAIAVRSVAKHRDHVSNPDLLTTDTRAVIENPEVDLVVELIGGIEPARELITLALGAGKPVVTGNKELLANHGAELYAAAAANGVDLLFEAAVAGGIPLIRPLRESLVGEDVARVMGIVNGTTNYILTQMAQHGAAYADALAGAQQLGYAEADPTADVEGYDAGAKAAIIASIAFGVSVVAGDVYHEGISSITSTDIEMAKRLDYVIKAVAVVEGDTSGDTPEVAVRVHPAMIPADHPLASVNDSFNAVFIEGNAVGDLMFYGRGAGGDPTASAVLGDVIDAALNKVAGTSAKIGELVKARIRPIDDLTCAYYLSIEVADRPGVLAQVAAVFGDHAVSIRSMEQRGLGDDAELIFITHSCREADVRATLHALRSLDSVNHINSLIRVVGA
jgi:homoserine dehydrogenase